MGEGIDEGAQQPDFPEEEIEGFDGPWLDMLTWIRVIDKYARGTGRHKLTPTCERHGIELTNAHTALDDATATGQLFFKTQEQFTMPTQSMGILLRQQMIHEANSWYEFNEFKSRGPR